MQQEDPGMKDEASVTYPTTTISSFPVELLIDIFWFTIETIHCPKITTSIQISSVCHYWREVCLGDSRLWSIIDVSSNVNLVALFLERCKGGPIQIYTTTTIKNSQLLTELLSPYWTLVCSMSTVGMGSARELVSLLKETQSSLPRLQSVRLCNHGTDIISRTPVITSHCSRISSLHLDQVHISLDLPVFRDMVCLRLEFISPLLTKMSSLTAILESSPRLQELHLTYVSPTFPLEAASRVYDIVPPKVISLPNLQQLFLKHVPSTISSLLSCLSFSRPTRVMLTCETEDFSRRIIAVFFNGRSLADYMSTAKWLRLEVKSKKSVTMHIDDLELIIQVPHYVNVEELSFRFRSNPAFSISTSPMALFPSYSPFLDKLALSFTNSELCSIRSWCNTLSHPNLQTIRSFSFEQSNDDPIQVTNFLVVLSGPGCITFSSLERLVVPSIRLSDAAYLVKFLISHAKTHSKLKELEIRDSRRKFHRRFVYHVESVVWNPREMARTKVERRVPAGLRKFSQTTR